VTYACRFSEKLDLRPRDAATGVLESFRSLLEETRRKPIATVTCPELGNVTFSSAPPFDVLGVPQCGLSAERVRITLYLPPDGEQQCQMQPFYLPNDVTTQCVEALRRRRATVRSLVILIHGFLKDFEAEWLHQMQAALQRTDNSLAVIVSQRPCLESATAAIQYTAGPNGTPEQFISDRWVGPRQERHHRLLASRGKHEVGN
jgi:hypothetical protein